METKLKSYREDYLNAKKRAEGFGEHPDDLPTIVEEMEEKKGILIDRFLEVCKEEGMPDQSLKSFKRDENMLLFYAMNAVEYRG